jgi:transmembrane sensor
MVAQLEAWEEEWEEFQPAEVLSPEISGKLWDGINKNVDSPDARYSYFRWLAVAASILLVIGLPWHFISKKQKTSIIGAQAVETTKHIFNNTARKMAFTLKDGSKVELLPNSMLSYTGNFDSLKRDVILNGGANFEIAKDVARPFTVSSNSVLTTVLGTRFTVKSYEASNTTVILHEGRVMIKIANTSSQVNKKEFFLTPGDIFLLNKVNASSRIGSGERMGAPKNVTSDSLLADSLSARVLHIEKDKEDRYLFNNYPLDVVFDQLQVIYNTTIVYDKSKLGNRSFIGKIEKKDSLYTILKSIALLNNFTLQKQGDSILVH